MYGTHVTDLEVLVIHRQSYYLFKVKSCLYSVWQTNFEVLKSNKKFNTSIYDSHNISEYIWQKLPQENS